MMRLPRFRYHAPRLLSEAAALLADLGPEAMPLAGGTDLLPNMKRRQQTPAHVVGLRGVEALSARSGDPARGLTLGAMTRLASLEQDGQVLAAWPALARAAGLVASPPLRNMATLGGNLCLDTRCTYYDQSEPWRASIGYCMKREGEVCWVAPGSERCWAVSSSDTAPVLCALGAEVTLTSKAGDRRIPAQALFADDGMQYLTRRPGEILSAIHLPPPRPGEKATYLKLRRRGSIDFPVLGVAARVKLGAGGAVEEAHLVLGAVGSRPQAAEEASKFLVGKRLGDAEVVAEASRLASQVAKPMQNTDFGLAWRKQAAREWVARALRELAG
ncbi:MAG: FAD binding domain-containing protein [Deltaproteobacteria bacterium]|nr:FAD binding domain-containing protein [Deltaproteobacteria bacterium]